MYGCCLYQYILVYLQQPKTVEIKYGKLKKMVKNIDVESIIAQKVEMDEAAKQSQEKKQKYSKVEFDVNNYLDTRLEKNENEKLITIRLLPFSDTELSPFKKIVVHSVKMTNENGKKVWKKFMCPIGMGKSDKCPFCEMADKARSLYFKEKDEVKKKEYGDIEFMNKPKDYWLVRCIDRAHEDHGVKFWRFPGSANGKGIFDQIYSIFLTRKEKGKNIFDLYNGKDLIINVKRQVNKSGKESMVYIISDDDEYTPLHKDESKMEEWVNDSKRWEDVYSVKDYEYMAIVAQGEYPVWSKNLNRFIASSDAEKISKEAKEQEVMENLTQQTNDFSSFTVDTGKTKTEKAIVSNSDSEGSHGYDDDLPF